MKLCVALDMESKYKCLNLVKELEGLDIWLKIGLRAYLRDGMQLIEDIKKISDFKIFLDLKIYDIPNTTADACYVLGWSDMITLHASCGRRAMECVMDRLSTLKTRPLVLAVSALTSFTEYEFREIYNTDLKSGVISLSQTAYESGLDGVVCSVLESLDIKNSTSDKFLTITPGIRLAGDKSDDQKRIADIAMAVKNKSDFIVVGRPIYQSRNPRNVVETMLSQF